MRVSSTASAKRPGSLAKPGASTSITDGVKIKATASSTIWLASSSVKTRSANKPAALGAALLADARIGRNEGGVKRALGENGPEMVGQAKGDKEGVGRGPGAEDGGQHDIADKAGHPRQQRQPAYRNHAINHRWTRPAANAKMPLMQLIGLTRCATIAMVRDAELP